MRPRRHIAIDLGGGSGRVIAGAATGEVEIVWRFPNRIIEEEGHTRWDLQNLFTEIVHGLEMAAECYTLASVGVDTWGVDVGFVDAEGRLLANPICYRDPYTVGAATAYGKDVYAVAGTQVMDINTLFQLRCLGQPPQGAAAMLFTPDLVSVMLGARPYSEYTIASTSQMLDARSRAWSAELVADSGIDPALLQPIVMPGSVVGHLSPKIRRSIGADYEVPIVAVAAHDTASAVYAIPAEEQCSSCAFLSSGTWSLLGTVLTEPLLTPEARDAGFTNEGLPDGKIAFLQNITGMWILERLIADWRAEGHDIDYATLMREAEESRFDTTVDVDHPDFASQAPMAQTIALHCNAVTPVKRGDYTRCVLRSLATRYARAISGLNALLPTPVQSLRIIGGGSQNTLLNRLTAEATGLPVLTGPVEATSLGNIKLQAKILPSQ